jgi:pimeloyl-ACP methyl ester carboxylesterase
MKFMKANGLVLHFSDQGRRDGPPLVFLNSLGTDLLASDFRIVVYDKRRHGLSEAGPDKNDIADDAGIFVYPDSRTPLCLALPVPVIRGYRHPPCFRAADSRRPRGPFSVCPNLF